MNITLRRSHRGSTGAGILTRLLRNGGSQSPHPRGSKIILPRTDWRIAMSPLISIIVPIYNREKYLNDCISSLLKQTYSNIEILLIDDGSTDASSEICKYYTDLYEKVRYYFITHTGVSAARNKGLDEAKGEYIMFCDSDDMVKKNWVSSFANYINDEVALIVGGFESLEDGEKILTKEIINCIDVSLFLEYRIKWSIHCVWMCCFKKSNIRFMMGLSYGEDTLFILEYINSMNNGSIIYVSDTLYRYRRNSNMNLSLLGRRNRESYNRTITCLESLNAKWGCSDTVWEQTVNTVKNSWYSQDIAYSSYRELKKLMKDDRWNYYVEHLCGGCHERVARLNKPVLIWTYFRLKNMLMRWKARFW